MRTVVFSLLFLSFYVNNTNAMEIEQQGGSNAYILSISGEIVDGDCDKITTFLRLQNSFPFWLTIQSGGGDVDEATCIGRFVRKTAIKTKVETFCASACVLVWGAGVERNAYELAVFGLHRPTFISEDFGTLAPNQAQDAYRTLQVAFRDYMVEMDFPSELIDRMMATKSSDVEQVTGNAMVTMIGKYSPGYEEWRISKCGEISESELHDRVAIMNLEAKHTLEAKGEYTKYIETSIGDEAKRAESFSQGYVDYLKIKAEQVKGCERDALVKMQKSYFENQ